MSQTEESGKRRSFPIRSTLWICLLILGLLTLLAPDFDESPRYTFESITDVRLAANGDVLVLRSSQHDFEFRLPPNHLEQAFAFYGDSFDDGPGCSFDEIAVHESGDIEVNLRVYFGGYDSRQREMKSVIPDADRAKFAAFGFRPTNFNVVGYDGPPLYMAWRAGLAGRQHAPGALPEGRDLGYRCQKEDKQRHLLSAETLQSNQRWNAILRPFHRTAAWHRCRDLLDLLSRDRLRRPKRLSMWLPDRGAGRVDTSRQPAIARRRQPEIADRALAKARRPRALELLQEERLDHRHPHPRPNARLASPELQRVGRIAVDEAPLVA